MSSGNKKKADKKADKAKKNKGSEAPANPIPATGENAAQVADNAGLAQTVKTPRIKKNATATALDFSNPETALTWIGEFYDQSKAHPPRKGYDQHWNSEGFIHAGPADRLPNAGAAKMAIFVGDMLAKRQSQGGTEGEEAGAALDFIINFLTTRRETLQEEENARILAAADAIRAKQGQAQND